MNLSDAYRILGLNENADVDEVKAAYKSLAQKYGDSQYQTGPLKDDAQSRMDEINLAFDTVMTQLRTGNVKAGSSTYQNNNQTSGSKSDYSNIRHLINHGNSDEALRILNAIPNSQQNAEWNFLVGSAYYYKGWVNDALNYFQTAQKMDPTNREYKTALQNLQNNQTGNMHGNPYGQRNNMYGSQVGCSCCDICAAFMCMDLCCNCGGC